jgi:hypothetical protein
MTIEETHLEVIQELLRQFPVRQCYDKDGKKCGISKTRQYRAREKALAEMQYILTQTQRGYLWKSTYRKDRFGYVIKNLVRGGVPEQVLSSVFLLLE